MASNTPAHKRNQGALHRHQAYPEALRRALAAVDEELHPELIARSQQGDREAFSQLIKILLPSISIIAKDVVGGYGTECVEDTADEVVAQIQGTIHSYRSEYSFRAWVARVCYNVCVTEGRKAKRYRQFVEPLPDDFDIEDNSPPDADADFSRERLYKLMRPVPEKYRVVLLLEYMFDLSDGEISQTLDIPLGTVKSRKSRGMNWLRTNWPPSTWEWLT